MGTCISKPQKTHTEKALPPRSLRNVVAIRKYENKIVKSSAKIADVTPVTKGRSIIGLSLPDGKSDTKALQQLIDQWVAPFLAEIYLDEWLQLAKSERRIKVATKQAEQYV